MLFSLLMLIMVSEIVLAVCSLIQTKSFLTANSKTRHTQRLEQYYGITTSRKVAQLMAVTIKQVSEYCGISISAVSKALNGYPDIGEKTRKRVIEAAKELGYRPSAIARGLKTGRTFNLGVVYSEDSGSGFLHHFFSPFSKHSVPKPSSMGKTSLLFQAASKARISES